MQHPAHGVGLAFARVDCEIIARTDEGIIQKLQKQPVDIVSEKVRGVVVADTRPTDVNSWWTLVFGFDSNRVSF